MAKSFLSATANYDALCNIKSGEINYYVQKNNEANLRKIFAFFQGESKILLLNGFGGTGKKQISEHILSFMDSDIIIFRFVCTESTSLDDVQLAFLDAIKRKISASDFMKCEAISSVKEKIDFLKNELNFRFVTAIYNFDSLTEYNKSDIQKYIFENSSDENTKTIIVSKVFNTDDIPENISYQKIMIKALSKDIFEEYVKEFGIRITNSGIDQLYRLTRGYFLYTCLSSKIMVNRELTLNDFIVQYSNSGVKFDDFLANAYYKLIVGSTRSVFNIALQLKHGFNHKMLNNFGSYPENILKTLLENYYLFRKSTLFYPSNFLKQVLSVSLTAEIKQETLVEYYQKQLEMPPNLRDFLISRTSLNALIAAESEYSEPQTDEVKPVETISIPQSDANARRIDVSTYKDLSSFELLQKAQEFYNSYEYREVFDLLFLLVDRKDDLKNEQLYKSVYILIAKTYTRLKRWKYALYYYSILADFVKDKSEEELNNIKYEMAVLYFESYQKSKAMQILTELVKTSNSPNLLLGCYIVLGNIALYSSNKDLALSYYKKGIQFVTVESDMQSVKELYFKYASLSDDKDDIASAIEYYKKCIDIKDDSNKYTPLAFSNLGELFIDNSMFQDAYECFTNAVEIYKVYKNDFGMYYCLSKLYELTDISEKDKKSEIAQKSKEYALLTGDKYAIINSTLQYGDALLNASDIESALKEYLEIYNNKELCLDEYNSKMLKLRLDDVKARIGKEKFEELVPNYA